MEVKPGFVRLLLSNWRHRTMKVKISLNRLTLALSLAAAVVSALPSPGPQYVGKDFTKLITRESVGLQDIVTWDEHSIFIRGERMAIWSGEVSCLILVISVLLAKRYCICCRSIHGVYQFRACGWIFSIKLKHWAITLYHFIHIGLLWNTSVGNSRLMTSSHLSHSLRRPQRPESTWLQDPVHTSTQVGFSIGLWFLTFSNGL